MKTCEDIVPRVVISAPEKMAVPIFLPKKILKLKEQLRMRVAAIRRKASDTLGDSLDVSVAESLIPLLNDKDNYVRQSAARSLGKLRADQAVQQIIKLLDDDDQDVQVWAAFGLHRMNNSLAEEALTRHQDKSGSDRLEKVKMLLSGYP